MAYEKEKDYKALMDEAAASENYRDAALYEQQRNEKITGEGLDYDTTNDYAGWLDDTDYAAKLKEQMNSGASASDVADTLGKRVEKASTTVGMGQYANDDVYQAAMDYILNNRTAEDFSYKTAPSYTTKYQGLIDQLTNDLLGKKEFSYNYEEDPLYKQYAEAYTRNGQRAMEDTLGQVSARTGGLASSYAGSAAQQSYNNYMEELSNIIPELEQQAYNRYNDDYDRIFALLDQYNTDRNFSYGVSADAQQMAQDRVSEYLAAGGLADELDEDLISSSGYTPAELAALEYYYRTQLGMSTGSSGSGSSGGGGGSSKKYDTHGYTKEEIRRLQANAGIAVDGIWGPDTEKAYKAGYRPDGSSGGDSETSSTPTSTDSMFGNGMGGKPLSKVSLLSKLSGDIANLSGYAETALLLGRNGISAAGLMTKQEWEKNSKNENDTTGASAYDSYPEYLRNFAKYQIQNG